PKSLIENLNCVIIRIFAGRAQINHVDCRLVHVRLVNHIVPRFHGADRKGGLFETRPLLPRSKRLSQLRLHRAGIEIAGKTENDVVGINVRFMPVEQVLTCDSSDGGVFRNSRVGTLGTVTQFCCLSRNDGTSIVVSARNRVIAAFLGDLQLVFAEFWVLQHVEKHAENVIEVLFQRSHANRGGIPSRARFYFGSTRFQEIIQLIAIFRLCSSRAPRVGIHGNQTSLGGGFVTRATADARETVDEGQFVVLLQKDHHSVGQGEALGLLRTKGRQWGNGYVTPIGCLRGGGTGG